jgi:hypothetical protein
MLAFADLIGTGGRNANKIGFRVISSWFMLFISLVPLYLIGHRRGFDSLILGSNWIGLSTIWREVAWGRGGWRGGTGTQNNQWIWETFTKTRMWPITANQPIFRFCVIYLLASTAANFRQLKRHTVTNKTVRDVVCTKGSTTRAPTSWETKPILSRARFFHVIKFCVVGFWGCPSPPSSSSWLL